MNHQRGNAFIITLVSVILLGALTFVTMRQMGASTSQTLSDEKATLYANQLIAQANEMKGVIDQMLTTGSTIDTLNYDLPSSGTFNSGTTINKVFHPAGGGLNVPAINPESAASDYTGTPNWGIQYGYNVEWTPSTDTDVIYTFMGVKKSICAKINFLLTGNSTIPMSIQPNGTGFSRFFSHGATDADFLSSDCSSCNGKPQYCVGKSGGNTTDYAFYSIVAQR